MDEPNPVKDFLYDYLKKFKEDEFAVNISSEQSPKLINKIIQECLPEICKLKGIKQDNIIKFATSLLHYLFTMALIPSQRKISYEGFELDMVIPDLKSLIKNPEKSLIICFLENNSIDSAKQKIQEFLVQPKKENIWFVTSEKINLENKEFPLTESSFSKIILDVQKFLKSTQKTQFKIFKT